MAHPYAKHAEHKASHRRAEHIAKAGGGAVGGDQAPFSSAGVADQRSRKAHGKTSAKPDIYAQGSKAPKSYARGGKTKPNIIVNIHTHKHPPMGPPGMAPGAGMMPPPGPPPNAGAPVLPPGAAFRPPGAPAPFNRGGHIKAGAATGISRLAEYERLRGEGR
jgi:hypothetical protein